MAISVENRKFSPPRVFCVPAEGVPLELDIGAWGKKTRMEGPPEWERSLTISLAVWIQYTNVPDGHTDRQTPGDSKDCAYA